MNIWNMHLPKLIDLGHLNLLIEIRTSIKHSRKTPLCPCWTHGVSWINGGDIDCKICHKLFPRLEDGVCPCDSDYSKLYLFNVLNKIVRVNKARLGGQNENHTNKI